MSGGSDASNRLRVNISPDLSVASYVQYDTDSDSVGVNTRLRWTFSPVGDLFVVYNHNVRELLQRWQLDSNQLLVKVPVRTTVDGSANVSEGASMRSIGVHTLVALALCAAISTVFAATQEAGTSSVARKPPTILFMCPHGAAKSVLASAYFQRAAKERGLNIQVRSAGTDPDPQVSPAVASHLKRNGYDVPVAKPRRATADDMEVADLVISIGCDLKDLPKAKGAVHNWDDVPALSEEFAAADAKIKEHVIQLVDELVRQQKRQ